MNTFKLDRAPRIQATVEVGDRELIVDLNATDVAMSFNHTYTLCLDAISNIKKATTARKSDPTVSLDLSYENLGKAVILLLDIVFGSEDTAYIVEFYQNNYTEMATEVLPFITQFVVPKVQETLVHMREKVARNKYGVDAKNNVMPFNRAQRRRKK